MLLDVILLDLELNQQQLRRQHRQGSPRATCQPQLQHRPRVTGQIQPQRPLQLQLQRRLRPQLQRQLQQRLLQQRRLQAHRQLQRRHWNQRRLQPRRQLHVMTRRQTLTPTPTVSQIRMMMTALLRRLVRRHCHHRHQLNRVLGLCARMAFLRMRATRASAQGRARAITIAFLVGSARGSACLTDSVSLGQWMTLVRVDAAKQRLEIFLGC
mmetsp:Transcript_10959/g.23433  ORF Transcript_10959/g.23433 Transcript_10959/m.23433 type:complete len:211 (+) Transcript_10959:1091-1723(+)